MTCWGISQKKQSGILGIFLSLGNFVPLMSDLQHRRLFTGLVKLSSPSGSLSKLHVVCSSSELLVHVLSRLGNLRCNSLELNLERHDLCHLASFSRKLSTRPPPVSSRERTTDGGRDPILS